MPKKNNNNNQNQPKAPTTIEDKARKAAGDATVDAILADGAEDLQNRLSSLAKHEMETEEKRDSLDDIKSLKDELKNLTGPFKDVLKSIALQRKLIAIRLEEMGK